MKALILFEVGSEIVEFYAPIDVLHRAGIETTVLVNQSGPEIAEAIKSLTKVVDLAKGGTLEDDLFNYDVLIIPGGKRGVEKLKEFISDENTKNRIIQFHKNDKLIAAICAAPSLLGQIGLLKNRDYTCYPGWESNQFDGNYTGSGVVRSGNIITGRSMYYSSDFGLEIVEYLLGKEKRIEIENQIKGIH